MDGSEVPVSAPGSAAQPASSQGVPSLSLAQALQEMAWQIPPTGMFQQLQHAAASLDKDSIAHQHQLIPPGQPPSFAMHPSGLPMQGAAASMPAPVNIFNRPPSLPNTNPLSPRGFPLPQPIQFNSAMAPHLPLSPGRSQPLPPALQQQLLLGAGISPQAFSTVNLNQTSSLPPLQSSTLAAMMSNQFTNAMPSAASPFQVTHNVAQSSSAAKARAETSSKRPKSGGEDDDDDDDDDDEAGSSSRDTMGAEAGAEESSTARGKRPAEGRAYQPKKCEHGRQKNKCVECRGAGICEHNRLRRICKLCGGNGICEHNRQRNICRDCKGSQICEHLRRRSRCKDCGGGQICPHGRRRSRCKECRGSEICEHQRERRLCMECRGSGICQHLRQRRFCKECKGEGPSSAADTSERGLGNDPPGSPPAGGAAAGAAGGTRDEA